MLLLHRHSFSVASYHQKIDSQQATEDLAQGLVVPVELVFESWLERQAIQADAFLDPGADNSMISLRWIHEKASEAGAPAEAPMMNPAGFILERIELVIGGKRLPLGNTSQRVWVGNQGDHVMDILSEMPGLEDLLLGRDFITQHGLLVMIDGDQRCLSILAPVDPQNREKRERIRAAFDTASA
jgi:hypothetical protein